MIYKKLKNVKTNTEEKDNIIIIIKLGQIR